MGDCFKTLQDSNIIWAEKLGLRNVGKQNWTYEISGIEIWAYIK